MLQKQLLATIVIQTGTSIIITIVITITVIIIPTCNGWTNDRGGSPKHCEETKG